MRKTSLLILAGVAAMSVASVASAAGINTKNETSQPISVSCTFNAPHTIAGNGHSDAGVTWSALKLAFLVTKKVTCSFSVPKGTTFATATITQGQPGSYNITPSNTSNYTITLETPKGNTAIKKGDITPIALTPESSDQDTIDIK